MSDLTHVNPTNELPDDVLEAYGFYGMLVEKGLEQSDARRATCRKYPRCEDALRPLWDMDEQLRRAGSTPTPLDSVPAPVVEAMPTVPAPAGFRAICKIGEGGQAEVWLARDLKLDRHVAIKVIKGSMRDSPRTHQRFRREVEITGKLEHPSIVPVYETGANPNGESAALDLPYYVMRLFINRHLLRAIIAFHERTDCEADKHVLHALFAFHSSRSEERRQALETALATLKFDPSQSCDLELKDAVEKLLADIRTGSGGSLHEAIEAHYSRGRPALGLRDLLGRFIDVCQAMAYAHSRGVIHRDLKPRNVMLGEFGETLVVDWGLSKIVGRTVDQRQSDSAGTVIISPDDSEVETETRIGTVTGTIQYMAPEQAWGRVTELNPATDIYSLGAILFTILTGKAPREATLSAAREGKVDVPSEVQTNVPKALERVCLKAMSKDPTDRYATATDLANDVRKWLADEPVSAWHEPLHRRARRWVKKHRTLVGSFAAAAFVCGVTLMIMLPEFNDLYQKFKDEQIANDDLVKQVGKRDIQLANSNALIEINAHEREGQNLIKLKPAEAIATFEVALAKALDLWNDSPEQSVHGHVVMGIYQQLAEVHENRNDHELASDCHRRGIEVCLIVLRGESPPAAGEVADTESTGSNHWLNFLQSRLLPLAEKFPEVTDGVGQCDGLQLACGAFSVIQRHAGPLEVVGNVKTTEDVFAARYLADSYSGLARVEWAQGHLNEAYQSMILSLSIQALLPSIESQSSDDESERLEGAPGKGDEASGPAAAQSHT